MCSTNTDINKRSCIILFIEILFTETRHVHRMWDPTGETKQAPGRVAGRNFHCNYNLKITKNT